MFLIRRLREWIWMRRIIKSPCWCYFTGVYASKDDYIATKPCPDSECIKAGEIFKKMKLNSEALAKIFSYSPKSKQRSQPGVLPVWEDKGWSELAKLTGKTIYVFWDCPLDHIFSLVGVYHPDGTYQLYLRRRRR